MRTTTACVVALCLIGCGRIGYGGQVLLVDVTGDRMAAPPTIDSPDDVAGGGLSVREALTIAANTPGPDTIRFDPRLFPDDAPVTIALGSPLPVGGDETAVEGDGAGVVLDASGAGGPAMRVESDGAIIRGLRFTSTLEIAASRVNVDSCRFAVPVGDAIRIVGGPGSREEIRLSWNELTDTGGMGIAVDPTVTGCSSLRISGNHITHAGGHLIYIVGCSGVKLDDNVLVIGDKAAQRGIMLERVTNSWLLHNVVDPGEAHLISLLDSSEIEIRGNVLDRGDAGVVLEGESHDNVVVQNAVTGCAYDGFYIGLTATRNTIVHNTILATPTDVANGAPDTVILNNFWTDDPAQFANAAGYDFSLVAGSAAVNAAVDDGFDCLPNDPGALFMGGAPDLGAVESH